MSSRARLALVVAAAAGVVALVTACSLFREPFEPQGAKATAARAAAAAEIEAQLDLVVDGMREHGRLRSDACHEGQDNWKRTDEFAWECRVGVAAVVDGAETRDEVAATLTDLHDRLLATGCTPSSGGGLLDVVQDYWLAHRDRPGYGPASLPFEVYTCPDGISVEVLSSAPDATDLPRDLERAFGGGFGGEVQVREEPLGAEALASAQASDADQLVIVRVMKRYYAIRT